MKESDYELTWKQHSVVEQFYLNCSNAISDALWRDVFVHRNERTDGHRYHMRRVFLDGEEAENASRSTDASVYLLYEFEYAWLNDQISRRRVRRFYIEMVCRRCEFGCA